VQNLFDELQAIGRANEWQQNVAKGLLLVSEALSRNKNPLRASKRKKTTQKQQRTSTTVKASTCTRHIVRIGCQATEICCVESTLVLRKEDGRYTHRRRYRGTEKAMVVEKITKKRKCESGYINTCHVDREESGCIDHKPATNINWSSKSRRTHEDGAWWVKGDPRFGVQNLYFPVF